MAMAEPDEEQRPFGPPRGESSNGGGLRNVGQRIANRIRGQGQGQGREAGTRRPNGLQGLFSDRNNSFIPESNKKCLMTNCESKCAPREVRADRDDVDAPCRQCIGALCRGGTSVPIFENLKCRNDAHSTCGPLFGCEVLDSEVVAQRSACQSCVDTCLPESVKMQARTKAQSRAMCIENCKASSCGHEGNCRSCVSNACKNSRLANCAITARTSCTTCKFTSAQRQQCKTCNENCRKAATSTAVLGTQQQQQMPATYQANTATGSSGGVFVMPVQTAGSCSSNCKSLGCPEKVQVDACKNCLAMACTDQNQQAVCHSAIISTGGICNCPGMNPDMFKTCSSCYSNCA